VGDRSPGGRGVEHHIEVPRTARYVTLGPVAATEVWIVLHGYGQLAGRFLRRFEPIDDGSRRIVAPEALSRFYVGNQAGRHGQSSKVGATWMTREDRQIEIADYVRYLDVLAEQALAGATKVIVLGFSQGVATAARWTTMGAVRPNRLVLWGDFLPPDLDLGAAKRRWRDIDVVLARGDGDRALGSEKLAGEEAERMAEAGLAPRTIRYDGGHDIDPETLMRLAAGTR
jgi:predicted esterase